MSCDLLIRGATIVTSGEVRVGDLAVRKGRIAAVADSLNLKADRVVNAEGRYLLPGFIDAHVHFNEPGRTEWEGVASGSRALAAGGGTCFIDMPLNSTPPVLDAPSFETKAAAITERSLLDAAIWGGLVPGHLTGMRELGACGVIGFKAFMSNSGIEEFSNVDRSTLRQGMKIAADLQLPVAVHAEDEMMTAELTRLAHKEGRNGIADYLRSRPIEAEVAAIGQALDCAQETGCSLHVVHVSSRAGLELIAAAKDKGIDVTAETCPHYLLLSEADVLRLGAPAKCAPPLRNAVEVAEMWRAVGESLVDTIGSDHSPAPPEMKTSTDFFKVWGGISGCQHALPLFFEAAVQAQSLSPSLVARLTATNVARRFRIEGKGDLVEGYDADMVLLDARLPHAIEFHDLLYRHPQSPYLGRISHVAVVETWARGESVYPKIPTAPRNPAQILRPSPL